MQALERDVVTLYEADYAPTWDLMLADLNVVQLRSLPQAAQDLYILASPEFADAQPAGVDQPATDAVGAARRRAAGRRTGRVGERHGSFVSRRCWAAQSADASRGSLPPGHEIDERYQALRDLVGHGPGAPIDQVLRELGDTQQQIAKLAATLVSTGAGDSDAGGIDPLLTLKADAARQPQPLGRWLTEIADQRHRACAAATRGCSWRRSSTRPAARQSCVRRW